MSGRIGEEQLERVDDLHYRATIDFAGVRTELELELDEEEPAELAEVIDTAGKLERVERQLGEFVSQVAQELDLSFDAEDEIAFTILRVAIMDVTEIHVHLEFDGEVRGSASSLTSRGRGWAGAATLTMKTASPRLAPASPST